MGVIDSGIDASHPDLDGRVDESLSRSFVYGESATVDPNGHGTHVAGIIGGIGNNTYGICGVCQNVTLVSLRVFTQTDFNSLGSLPTGESSYVLAAINYADENDIPILNLSLSVQDGFTTVIAQELNNYPGIAVCAAGNDGLNAVASPASEDCDNIISVGASTQSNTRASFSNYGQQDLDLFAPGHEIASCYPTELCENSECDDSGHIADGYHYLSGTSMATPYVTGVVALMLSSHDVSPSTIKWLILNKTEPYAAFRNLCVSGGILNAYNALNDPTLHSIYGNPINANRHRVYCTGCNYSAVGYHTYNGNGACMICGYPD